MTVKIFNKSLIFLLFVGLYPSILSAAEVNQYKPNQSWFYGGFHIGSSKLTTDENDEAGEKEGQQYGVMASSTLEYSQFDLNIAATYYFLNFESDRVENVKYDLETKTLALEASPLFRLNSNLSLGPKFQFILTEKMLVGPSDKENTSEDDVTTNMLIGLNGFFKHKVQYAEKEFNLRYGLHIHKPINIGNRDITILLLSLELGQIINL
jgi:hypothetical protein